MKYKNQSEVVEAVQWFQEGDHPEVIKLLITPEGTVTEDSIIFPPGKTALAVAWSGWYISLKHPKD